MVNFMPICLVTRCPDNWLNVISRCVRSWRRTLASTQRSGRFYHVSSNFFFLYSCSNLKVIPEKQSLNLWGRSRSWEHRPTANLHIQVHLKKIHMELSPLWPWCLALLLLLSHFSRVRLCATPETAAHQAPPSMGCSRQEHWSGFPFPPPVHESEKWKWSRSVVFDSSRPHGLQPTRFPHLWDFPGKSTGVGCHCLLWMPCSRSC